MNASTLTCKEIRARYELLCRSTQAQPTENILDPEIETQLQELQSLLDNDLRALARQGSPDDFTDLYLALQQELKRFKECCIFPAPAKKVLVAFGGGFSAGKSSLINALLGERLLVTEIDPTTSLPTYLLQGEANAIQAINFFGHLINVSLEEFQSLTHDEVEKYDSNVSRLLRTAFITRTNFPWSRLAIVDTPGYTKHENPGHSDHTDEELSRNHLNAAQAIVWVIDARKGCITEDDLNFLATLQEDIPRFFVVSRADQKSPEDIERILAGIRQTLEERKLPFVNVVATSIRKQQLWPLAPVFKYLNDLNKELVKSHFSKNFNKPFNDYILSINKKQRYTQSKIDDVNRICLLSNDSETQKAIETQLKHLKEKAQKTEGHKTNILNMKSTFIKKSNAIGEKIDIPINNIEFFDWHDIQKIVSYALSNIKTLVKKFTENG